MSLTLASVAALFGAMVLLAALPSTSVMAVTTRAASQGFAHGALVAAGVVAGDVIFIVVALFGLALLMQTLAAFGPAIRGVGGTYLVWLGWQLWCARAGACHSSKMAPSRHASFAAGLLITLADQKAILFYLGFFPAFVDLERMTVLDALALILIATVAVGGVKLAYAAAADRASVLLGSRFALALNRIAACVMLGIGLYLWSSLFLHWR